MPECGREAKFIRFVCELVPMPFGMPAVHVDPLAILRNFSKLLNSFLGDGEPVRQDEFATY